MLFELSGMPAALVELQRGRFSAQRQHGRLALRASRTALSLCFVAMVGVGGQIALEGVGEARMAIEAHAVLRS